MLLRRAAERPQCVLQTFGQGRETFAAEHDVSVLEAGEDEPEVIEPMIERPPAMETPRQPVSVKSDSPSRPGSCSWRKITSCSGP